MLLQSMKSSLRLYYCIAIVFVAPARSFLLEGSVVLPLPTQRGRTSYRVTPWRLSASPDPNNPSADTPPPPPTDKNDESTSFVLPLFPLRKSIKLPGEVLTLNLYEDRYLALATYIRDGSRSTNATTQRACFGALYTSDKPQIVTDAGTGPIVPMLDEGGGDVGVLFPVERYEDSLNMTTDGGQKKKRRIRLVGTGLARFCIETILHDGHGGGRAVEQDGEEALPFIVARVRLYDDEDDDNNDDGETATSAITNHKDRLSPLSTERLTWLTNRAIQLGLPAKIMQDEFASFLLASTKCSDSVSEDRKAILKCRSTRDRTAMLQQKGW